MISDGFWQWNNKTTLDLFSHTIKEASLRSRTCGCFFLFVCLCVFASFLFFWFCYIWCHSFSDVVKVHFWLKQWVHRQRLSIQSLQQATLSYLVQTLPQKVTLVHFYAETLYTKQQKTTQKSKVKQQNKLVLASQDINCDVYISENKGSDPTGLSCSLVLIPSLRPQILFWRRR